MGGTSKQRGYVRELPFCQPFYGFLWIFTYWYLIYLMILIERWMPHRTEEFSIVVFDSKRLSLNLNPWRSWSVWTFQEDDILQWALFDAGNFGFIQTMRAMDQKFFYWLVMIFPMKFCIAHWVCPICPIYQLSFQFFSVHLTRCFWCAWNGGSWGLGVGYSRNLTSLWFPLLGMLFGDGSVFFSTHRRQGPRELMSFSWQRMKWCVLWVPAPKIRPINTYPLVNKHRPWKSPIFNGN